MTTKKYKFYCDGRFLGFIFISEGHAQFPGSKLSAIWHFGREGEWTTGNLELIERGFSQDLFSSSQNDEDIIEALFKRAGIKRDQCRTFAVEPYQ